MHFEYSVPYKSFDRRLLRYKLNEMKIDLAFTRNIEGHTIAGIYDDLRVLWDVRRKKKVVSLIEVKTTSRKRFWTDDEKVAVFQLKIYVWLLEPYIEKLRYELHSRHYVEAYSQITGRLMKRITVQNDGYTEFLLSEIIKDWNRTSEHATDWVCKRCPRNVKEVCEHVSKR